jgi:hypothetical protein
MGIDFYKIGLLATATQLFLTNGCTKSGTKPCATVTPFNVTASFSPQREVYRIGDTIYLASAFSKSLTNTVSGQTVDYGNSVGIYGTVSFIRMDTVAKNFVEAYPLFTVLPLKGSFTQQTNSPALGISSLYAENTSYEFGLGIIPKQKGLFFIGVNDLASQGIRGQNCTNAAFGVTVANTNKNLSLFEYALGYPADALREKLIYCFRVQ